MKKKLRVLAFFSQKGGSGKTTLAIHSAVAASESANVVLVDCDPQESSAGWSLARESDSPMVLKGSPFTIGQIVESAKKEGVDWLIIDCPPHAQAGVAQILAHADLICVPVQPSALDISALPRALEVIEAAKRPHFFTLNRTPPRAVEVDQAAEHLASLGEFCPVQIGERRAFSRALTGGLAVTEFEKGKATAEIEDFWKYVKRKMT